MSHAKPTLLFTMSLLVAVAATGCATGPKFERITNIPDGQGVVYIYRSASPIGGAIQPVVNVAGKGTVCVSPGGYTYAVAPAGEVEVSASTEATSSVTVDLKPKGERFIRESIGVGFFMGRPNLVEVPSETALEEIQSKRLQQK